MSTEHEAGAAQALRWGILGTGAIASELVEGIRLADGAELVAVGSRSAASAERFGERFAIPRRHATYDALVNDPRVDVVYVATPHALHQANTLMALAAGKHVLCEKPVAINAAQAREMIAAARTRGLLLMEAMWTRTLPLVVEIVRRIEAGEIGDVRLVEADFGFRGEPDESPALFDPDLGGGSLLDVGVYPVSLAHLFLGPPDHVSARADMGPTGVDHSLAAVLEWDNGSLAVLSSSIVLETAWTAEIVGTAGRVTLERPWWRPEAAVITNADGISERLVRPYIGNGYAHEVLEACRCIRACEVESPLISHGETAAVMDTLDRIRASVGLVYPVESAC